MATAIKEFPPIGESHGAAPADPSRQLGDYRCECGNVLRTFGGGRHRVYFEPVSTGRGDPVMNGACPSCGRGLPGKNCS